MTDHKAVAPKHPFRSNWTEMLASREVFRDKYRTDRDPIASERLLWRAQSFRHLVHLTPDQSILEFGCGDLAFTTKLAEVTRCENPIFAATFVAESEAAQPGTARALPASVTFLRVEDIARD